MANFPGNIISRISSHLQFRGLFIPWVMKSNATAITCLQRRDCGSSVPVRYIPKKSSKIEKSERPLPINDSKKNEFCNCSDGIQKSFVCDDEKSQNQNPMLANNVSFSDFKLACVDYEFIEEPKEVVEEFIFHQGKDCKPDVSCDTKTKQEAEKLATELLATRGFTAVEMRKKLQGKRFSVDAVEAVIKKFQSRGFINDSLYAETFSRSRWSVSSWGPRRIKLALLKKGVSEVDAENAVKVVFEDGESGDQESSLGLSKLSMDQLYIQASKQWHLGRDLQKETRKSRIIRWLQYRGFNWGVITTILKKLES